MTTILVQTDPVPAEIFGREIRRIAPDIRTAASIEEADPQDVEAILAWRLVDGLASRCPNLKMVSSMASGVDKILPAKDLAPDIPVMRIVDEAQGLAMGQWVALMALRHLRGLDELLAQQQRREWKRLPPPQPYAQTVCVLGLGLTGQNVARLLQVVGFNVVGWSRSEKRLDGIRSFTGEAGLTDSLGQSDILVCLLPLTQETTGILNRRTLGWLRPGGYLINVARGGHLVEADLVELIRSGHLAGAALDVASSEPLPEDHFLWATPNVTITPHMAAEPSAATVAAQMLAGLRRVQAGLLPENVADRRKGY
jgi:D-3-phosphoglycerate dehydrogenase/glyoxylate/hydroxypyruvate reductase A